MLRLLLQQLARRLVADVEQLAESLQLWLLRLQVIDCAQQLIKLRLQVHNLHALAFAHAWWTLR